LLLHGDDGAVFERAVDAFDLVVIDPKTARFESAAFAFLSVTIVSFIDGFLLYS